MKYLILAALAVTLIGIAGEVLAGTTCTSRCYGTGPARTCTTTCN